MFHDQLRLTNRYTFTGKLQLQSPLKIGHSIEGLPRTPEGLPVIPGSTMRGAFRRHVERVLATLGHNDFEPCALRGSKGSPCFSVNEPQRAEFQKLLSSGASASDLEAVIRKKVCAVCKLFGTYYVSSKLSFPDLLPVNDGTFAIGERYGMAIDRTTEVGRVDTRYRYEVIERGSVFLIKLIAENLDPDNLTILALGLLEAQRGGLRLGGGRSHGAGACLIDELEIKYFEGVGKNAEEKGKLLAYLDQGEDGLLVIDAKSSARQLRQWQRRLL